MSLPEQVRRQAERANELIGQAPATPGDPITEPVVLEPEAPQAVEPPAPAAPATPAEAPAGTAPPVVDWEQKYRTLQGVFSAESGRLNAEKKVLETRITALEQARVAPAPAPQAPAPLVNEKDLETYGPEMLDVIGRKATEIAKQIVAEQMAAQKPQLDQINAQVSDVQARVYRTSEDKFYGELANAVPDWQAINQDPRWLAWLGEVDTMSGKARQAFLDEASQGLDHVRATAMFTAFKTAHGLNAQAPAPAVTAPAAALSPSPRPVGAASAPRIQAPQEGVKRSEIGAHYARSARDANYRGSTAHKDFEVRVATAMANNQIIEA